MFYNKGDGKLNQSVLREWIDSSDVNQYQSGCPKTRAGRKRSLFWIIRATSAGIRFHTIKTIYLAAPELSPSSCLEQFAQYL